MKSGGEVEAVGAHHLRQSPNLAHQRVGHRPIDLNQSDRLAARRATTEVEGRDIDVLLTQQTAKGADKAGLVPVTNVKHVATELGLHRDALNLDQTGLVTTDQRAADSATAVAEVN